MTYLNHCYPSSLAEMHLVEVWSDLWLDNATDHKYLTAKSSVAVD